MTTPFRVGDGLSAAICLCLILTGCASEELQAPPVSAEGTLTVDASAGWAYVSLAQGSAVAVTDPASELGWDLAFNATGVMLNGGAAGPGGVAGRCLCQNAGATDQEIVALTADSELADFRAVTTPDVPAAAEFESEALVPALRGWYTGAGAGATAATSTTWQLRLHDGSSFAKVRILTLAAPTADHAGQVILEYAVQAAADQPFSPARTVTLDAAVPTRLDLVTGATSPAEGSWDLALEGFTIRLNGGVSGTGSAAAAATTEDFAAVTTASIDPRAYQQDAFAGVFHSHPWYKYNLTGENIIHPTFDVYLVQRGAEVHKLQLINYYGPAGEPRRITLRYARLTE